MSELFEDPTDNVHDYTVSEISGAIRRTLEGSFGRVRVRGEIGRVVVSKAGHVYADLKDDRSVLAGVIWKNQAQRLVHAPEEGLEVVATGRLSTFGPQSKYQLIIEDMRPAGLGALMAMLEARKAKLHAEGLFDPARKSDLPFLPEVIGVVTSPTGAVIRDILHRLRDRFPRTVLVWPVSVQGKACATDLVAAINGFNRLEPGGAVPRPDVLIVARGGGSIEDLWGFNEEIVVRAVAGSAIPLISAVGHETDTTLIDHAADRRAPTPTAAAEMAVPVRLDLLARTEGLEARLTRCATTAVEARRRGVRDLSRAIPRPEVLVATARQRLDLRGTQLPAAGRRVVQDGRQALRDPVRALPAPGRLFASARQRLDRAAGRLPGALRLAASLKARALSQAAGRLSLGILGGRWRASAERLRRSSDRRLESLVVARLRGSSGALQAADRLRRSLGYEATLERGYAVIRAEGRPVATRRAAVAEKRLEVQFRDGRIDVLPEAPPPRTTRATEDRQARLL